MTLDEKYFEEKLYRLDECIDDDTMIGPMIRDDKAKIILHQIAADARREQAEKDREEVEKLLPDFLVGVDCSGGFNKPVHLVEVGAYKKGTILAALDRAEG